MYIQLNHSHLYKSRALCSGGGFWSDLIVITKPPTPTPPPPDMTSDVTAALSNDTTNNRKLTTYYFNDDVLDLEAEDNGPDETQDKSRVAIDDILRANTLEANLKNMTRREP